MAAELAGGQKAPQMDRLNCRYEMMRRVFRKARSKGRSPLQQVSQTWPWWDHKAVRGTEANKLCYWVSILLSNVGTSTDTVEFWQGCESANRRLEGGKSTLTATTLGRIKRVFLTAGDRAPGGKRLQTRNYTTFALFLWEYIRITSFSVVQNMKQYILMLQKYPL